MKKKHLITNDSKEILAENKLGIEKRSVGMKKIQDTELKMPSRHRIGIFSSGTPQSPLLIPKADFLKSTI